MCSPTISFFAILPSVTRQPFLGDDIIGFARNEHLRKGGLALWVTVPHADAEQRVLAVLQRTGARDIHVHEINRERSLTDLPFTAAVMRPGLLLEKDRPFPLRGPASHHIER
jgi:hypothetical protein